MNDSYGHQAGDEVLKEVSNMVKSRLRESDQFFRYGGEEFAVLIPHTNGKDGFSLAQNIRSLLECKHLACINGPITISGGVSQVVDNDELKSWIERSDKALYEAKAKGRNQVILV